MIKIEKAWSLEAEMQPDGPSEKEDIKMLFRGVVPPSYKGMGIQKMIKYQKDRYGAVIYDPRKRMMR